MKGYVVCVYKSIANEEKLKEYAVKARKAVEKYKGKFLIRGDKANMFYNSSEYQEAHAVLKGHAIRHHQTIEGS